ncbi:MAG: Bax inhibitor-1/YccA family protein [Selenomonas sp.]|uniref:Bax inhibitor-1/YccA family membrane protein n=1 Tax=Selenomonas sp. TaxID=2053611 RepID=UPI0025EF770A|nr:Bax inhibitor-1/YccA family protein [Selenomonas sp.]MCR5757260.1 Bax inhibitor-1/YccA family protein [Selenomonas sp.]
MENPMLSKIQDLRQESFLTETASYAGVAVKEILMILLVTAAAFATIISGYATMVTTGVACAGCLIMTLIVSFKPGTAGFISPLFAIFEGASIAMLSMIAEAFLPGAVLQAVLLTFTIAIAAALVFSQGWITVDAKFSKGVTIALLGLLFGYLLRFVLSYFFSVDFGFMDGGLIGIGINLLIIGLATACLLIDYSQIQEAVSQGLPKDYEWFCAFSLLITLIWLYVRCIDLLLTISNMSDD